MISASAGTEFQVLGIQAQSSTPHPHPPPPRRPWQSAQTSIRRVQLRVLALKYVGLWAHFESISTFASIPRPLDPENGKVRLRSAFSLSKFKARKALEIAVCIDGESLDIYSVRRF